MIAVAIPRCEASVIDGPLEAAVAGPMPGQSEFGDRSNIAILLPSSKLPGAARLARIVVPDLQHYAPACGNMRVPILLGNRRSSRERHDA